MIYLYWEQKRSIFSKIRVDRRGIGGNIPYCPWLLECFVEVQWLDFLIGSADPGLPNISGRKNLS